MPDASRDRQRSAAQLFGGKGGCSGNCKRDMHAFREPKRTPQFFTCLRPIRQYFALKRHLLRASLNRKQLFARSVDWCEFAHLVQKSVDPRLNDVGVRGNPASFGMQSVGRDYCTKACASFDADTSATTHCVAHVKLDAAFTSPAPLYSAGRSGTRKAAGCVPAHPPYPRQSALAA